MLKEVRCRTCDISLAIAGSTFRITSRVRRSSAGGWRVTSARTESDDKLPGRRDLEPIARKHQRRARVLLDDGGAGDRGAGRERVAPVNRAVERRVEPDAADG